MKALAGETTSRHSRRSSPQPERVKASNTSARRTDMWVSAWPAQPERDGGERERRNPERKPAESPAIHDVSQHEQRHDAGRERDDRPEHGRPDRERTAA